MARKGQAVVGGRMEGPVGLSVQLNKQFLAALCELADDSELLIKRNVEMQCGGALKRYYDVSHQGENGGDKLVHGSGGISQRGRSKTLPPVAFDLF